MKKKIDHSSQLWDSNVFLGVAWGWEKIWEWPGGEAIHSAWERKTWMSWWLQSLLEVRVVFSKDQPVRCQQGHSIAKHSSSYEPRVYSLFIPKWICMPPDSQTLHVDMTMRTSIWLHAIIIMSQEQLSSIPSVVLFHKVTSDYNVMNKSSNQLARPFCICCTLVAKPSLPSFNPHQYESMEGEGLGDLITRGDISQHQVDRK